jgi:hypothetical protein
MKKIKPGEKYPPLYGYVACDGGWPRKHPPDLTDGGAIDSWYKGWDERSKEIADSDEFARLVHQYKQHLRSMQLGTQPIPGKSHDLNLSDGPWTLLGFMEHGGDYTGNEPLYIQAFGAHLPLRAVTWDARKRHLVLHAVPVKKAARKK